MVQVHDVTSTTPPPTEDDARTSSDPLEGVGTLTEQARRLDQANGEAKTTTKKGRKLTKFEESSQRITSSTGSMRMKSSDHLGGVPISETLGDVESLDRLIDDRIVQYNQLSASFHPTEGFRIQCFEPPRPAKDHPADMDGEENVLNMVPTQSFLQSLSRCVNDRTHVSGLTGTFLKTMFHGPDEAKMVLADLINHLFRQLDASHTIVDNDDEEVVKPILLRTLRRDIRPERERRWPKIRGCRALLHKGYRDDISHVWLMRLISDLVPGGFVRRYHFDGGLLRGAALIPNMVRAEKDSDYGGGVFFFSGEVGNRRCGVVPFVYRSVSSSITLVGDPWGVTHSGKVVMSDLAHTLKDYVHGCIPLVTTSIDRLLRSRDIVFESKDSFLVERLLISLGTTYRQLSKQDLRLWRVGIEAERNMLPGLALSVFTLQNGLTRMSQSVDDIVRQLQLDTIAGRLIDADVKWDKIVDRARTIDDGQVKEVFPS